MNGQQNQYGNQGLASQAAFLKHHLPVIVAGILFLVAVCASILLLGANHHRKVSSLTASSAVNGTQLARLLPGKTAVPAGWTFGSIGTTGSANLHGFSTPIPLGQCSYIGGWNGIGILFGLRSEQAYASETDTQYSSSSSPEEGLPTGTLTMTFAELLPGAAPEALATVGQWVKACPSWEDTDLSINYTSSIAPVTGLGQQAIDIHAIPQSGSSGYTTEILVVQVTNRRLVIITDTTQAGGVAVSPAVIARPLVGTFK